MVLNLPSVLPSMDGCFSCWYCLQRRQERVPTKDTAPEQVSKADLPPPPPLQKRSEQEVQEKIKSWMVFVHPRARSYFESVEKCEEVLGQLARLTDRNDDLILGDEDSCVHWYGPVCDNGHAILSLLKPGHIEPCHAYLTRILSFMFATDELYEKLMPLPKVPFRMSCGKPLCVFLGHVSAAEADEFPHQPSRSSLVSSTSS